MTASQDGGSAPVAQVPAADGSGSADVRLVSGHVSEAELAAIAVVVSAMSVASRAEAYERRLAQRYASSSDGWMDPVHRIAGAHDLRCMPSESAWQFSDR